MTGWGCSAQGLGVANYGGMQGVYLVGDWCTGRVFGLGWDGSAWQLAGAGADRPAVHRRRL